MELDISITIGNLEHVGVAYTSSSPQQQQKVISKLKALTFVRSKKCDLENNFMIFIITFFFSLKRLIIVRFKPATCHF